MTSSRGVNGLNDDSDYSDSEYSRIYDDPEQVKQETKGWNLFREIPIKKDEASSIRWVEVCVKILKLAAYIVVFFLVLGSAAVSKGTFLFITSQLKKDREIHHCNKQLALDQQFITVLPFEERILWLWAALIAFSIPELGIFLRSARICFFKTAPKATSLHFIIAFIIDTLQTIGIAILVLAVLPNLDVLKGAMLLNAMCLIPGILNMLSRDRTDAKYYQKILLDVLAISAQVTAFFVWPLTSGNSVLWFIPFACVLVSLGWWENYINYIDKNSLGVITYLYYLRDNLKRTRYNTQLKLTFWKIILFMFCIMLSLFMQGEDPLAFFTSLSDNFAERTYLVQEIQIIIQDTDLGIVEFAPSGDSYEMPIAWSTFLWIAMIQVGSSYICYICSIFACKILIQNFSFTFALSLVGPLVVNVLIIFCAIRNRDSCAYHDVIPDYLFFEIPPVYFIWDYIAREMTWVWVLWVGSQAWITFHAWQPRTERLAASDKLFRKPWYSGVMVDQSLLLNRSKDDDTEILLEDLNDLPSTKEELNDDMFVFNDVKPSDHITRIYVCATMWHETRDEMMTFLKSIFRMDEDQCARRVAQRYLGIVDPDYYELETHIFMDDAFEISDHSAEDSQVNRFVKCLVEAIDEAASEVHLVNMKLRPPKKYPSSYGGRLVWTMPGKTKLICHLKDKSKIRHRKRWSQVMYMYYFLGHRLMDLPISVERKEVIAENTYLLALDGDIDFKPNAVTLLMDLMKKDKNLGAACGRVHPVGSGFMAWYQMFEYAIGHWLQKATEHMIGCVLCSPGCFSLFRGKALMDDNVMKKYTLTPHEARHFVQYDQGEDRWLCTLLLQRGYRVEYSAASDSYTHCPEHFDEFFNQRRRWVPSTMANIFDLLADSKRTVAVNDSISTLYVAYQMFLMTGSILGPGTIFLMLVGALNSITGLSNVNALLINAIPIVLFLIVCLTCDSKIQLMLANFITCLYVMMMMVVMVGIVLQIIEDGWLAPSSIFTVITFSVFFITAALHPQEINCLFYILVYYITIPSMYMLLIIYSLCNLNNVSWGTREVAQKKTAKEMEMEKKAAEEAQKKMESKSLMSWLGKSEEENGSIEIGVSGLFRCICCTNPNDHKEDIHLLKITHSLEKIEKRLDNMGAPAENVNDSVTLAQRRRSSMPLRGEVLNILEEYSESESTDTPRDERDDLINPYWIEDPNLLKGEVDFLTTAETEFWKELIDTYLTPIDENKEEKERIETDLKNLRNLMVFAFMMINVLFVLTIFILQLNQDQLHIKWPLGQKNQVAYETDTNIVTITQDYLMLEPIGTLFIVFFGSVMIIQFTAMVAHRFGTFTHLLSTAKLDWYCTKKYEDLNQNTLLEKNAIEIVRDLQRLNDDDLQDRSNTEVGRRKTVQNLVRKTETKSSVRNLDSNFKRRLTTLQNSEQNGALNRLSSLGTSEVARRATLRALQTRRDSLRHDNALPRESNLIDFPGRRSTVGYANQGYEPAFDAEDDDILPPMPRRSTVRFKETFT